MMQECEYRKCAKAGNNKSRLLRTWDSFDHIKNPSHHQNIWLCDKHLAKIDELLPRFKNSEL